MIVGVQLLIELTTFKEMAKKTIVLFTVVSALASFALAQNEPSKTEQEDPKKSLENLAMFFKMMSSGENGTCTINCPGGEFKIRIYKTK